MLGSREPDLTAAYHGSLGRNCTPSPRRRPGRPPASPDRFLSHAYDAKSYDAVVFDILKVEPEAIAKQITLEDLPLFKAIRPDELTSCAWTSKEKLVKAPNVVAYTRRFNHINFWVQKEILKEKTLSKRCCVLAHFIKICKRLVDMNNLQSAMSILSALQSAPIYRLSRTWDSLSRRDRATFEKMVELFSEANNRQNLREFCSSLRIPCIPYLGMYLTDLTYIDVAHPSTGGLESQARLDQMNNILRVIANFQCSEYDIEPVEHILAFLTRQQYIEELQKFTEDENFKRSQELEPNVSSSAAPSSNLGDRGTGDLASAGGLTSQVRPSGSSRALPTSAPTPKLSHGHRKVKSLGNAASLFPSVSTSDLRSASPLPQHLLDESVTDAASARCLVPTPTGAGSRDELTAQSSTSGVPLLTASPSAIAPASSSDTLSSSHGSTLERALASASVVCEGCLKRKTLKKSNRKPTMAAWTKYWVTLTECEGLFYLHYFPAKTAMYARERHDFRKTACKTQCLKGAIVHQDAAEGKDCFLLIDLDAQHQYKFRAVPPLAPSESFSATSHNSMAAAAAAAERWCVCLNEAIKAMHPDRDLIQWSEDT